MLSTSAFIQAMIPLYIMGLIGFVARKKEVFNHHANDVMTQVLLYVTLPSLIIFSLDTNFSTDLLVEFFWLLLMSFFILSLSIILAYLLRKKAVLARSQKSVYESLIIFGNQGFIGFAVSYFLFADLGVVYLTFFNIIYLILIWTYGIYLFNRSGQVVKWKLLFLNPGIVATIIGLIILFSPFSLPIVILDTLETVGKVTIPLSMLLIGSMIAEISIQEMKRFIQNLYLWLAAFFKLILLPICLFIFLLFDLPFKLIVIAVLTAGMPSASTTSVYAQKFGGDVSFSSFGVMLSTLLCVITIPLLYVTLQWLHSYFF